MTAERVAREHRVRQSLCTLEVGDLVWQKDGGLFEVTEIRRTRATIARLSDGRTRDRRIEDLIDLAAEATRLRWQGAFYRWQMQHNDGGTA